METERDERLCTATSKRSGDLCKRYAVRGGTVCSMHGGKARQVKAAAERRVQTQAVEKDLAAILGHEAIEPITDPVLVLAELAAEVRALVRALYARVNALDKISYMSMHGVEQTRAEVTLLGDAQDRLTRILTALGRFDLDERRVQLSEQQAAMLSEVINRVITKYVPPQQLSEAEQFTATVLREVATLEVTA